MCARAPHWDLLDIAEPSFCSALAKAIAEHREQAVASRDRALARLVEDGARVLGFCGNGLMTALCYLLGTSGYLDARWSVFGVLMVLFWLTICRLLSEYWSSVTVLRVRALQRSCFRRP